MTEQAFFQLLAVLVGGVLATAGGIMTTLVVERRRHRQDSLHLALAFKGEISALLELFEQRHYLTRFSEVIQQIDQTGQPFYMPFRIRYQYDRVYEGNVNRIGILKTPLPEIVPRFYTRLTSIMEDMVSLGDGTYAHLDLALLLRIYRDNHRILAGTLEEGKAILAAIDRAYPPS